jgi:hypothetical protein
MACLVKSPAQGPCDPHLGTATRVTRKGAQVNGQRCWPSHRYCGELRLERTQPLRRRGGMRMQVMIHIEEGASGTSLMSWLRDDPVAGFATFSPAHVSQEELGAGDVIEAIIENTVALGELIVAVAAWRDARHGRAGSLPQVSLERGEATMTVTSGDSTEVVRIVRALEQQPDAPGGGEGSRSSP